MLVIRPEGATLAEQGLLEGTVTLSTFMGSYQYYQVMVGNMEIQITDYNPVNRRIYEVGRRHIWISIPRGFTSCRRIGTIGSMRNRMRMKKSWSIYIAVIGMSLCLAGCAGSGTSAAAGNGAGADRAAGTEHDRCGLGQARTMGLVRTPGQARSMGLAGTMQGMRSW